jgi:hypothetical protein
MEAGMARNEALDSWLRYTLREERNLTEKAMFGGMAWLLNGHLLCGSREDGMLARVGPTRNAWALGLADVAPMIMRGRAMDGWVRAGQTASVETRSQLVEAARAFVQSLPAKAASGGATKARPSARARGRR